MLWLITSTRCHVIWSAWPCRKDTRACEKALQSALQACYGVHDLFDSHQGCVCKYTRHVNEAVPIAMGKWVVSMNALNSWNCMQNSLIQSRHQLIIDDCEALVSSCEDIRSRYLPQKRVFKRFEASTDMSDRCSVPCLIGQFKLLFAWQVRYPSKERSNVRLPNHSTSNANLFGLAFIFRHIYELWSCKRMVRWSNMLVYMRCWQYFVHKTLKLA